MSVTLTDNGIVIVSSSVPTRDELRVAQFNMYGGTSSCLTLLDDRGNTYIMKVTGTSRLEVGDNDSFIIMGETQKVNGKVHRRPATLVVNVEKRTGRLYSE